MKTNMTGLRYLLSGLSLVITFNVMSFANNVVPGPKQDHPVLLKGGTVYTVSGSILPDSDVLFDKGRITQIGTNLSAPQGTEVIDVTGQNVYPGLIDGQTSIGLVEIGAIRATNDVTEIGDDNPDVLAMHAYNPDSDIIPTIRFNGVTTALVVPGGSVICGRSSLMNLDGWTREDATEKPEVALHINWPQAGIARGWWVQATPEEQKKQAEENKAKIRRLFNDARAYYVAKAANPNIDKDSHWEAMLPVFTGELPVFINADDYRQIEDAVAFAREYKLRMVLVSGKEAWKLTDLLKSNNIPVVCSPTFDLPMRQDDDYDQPYRLPKLLSDAGIKFCFATFGASGSRNLPFYAGQAVAYGLSKENAVRALTLSPAEIMGVSKDVGSIEIGKKATLVVSRGDILDPMTQKVSRVFIEGKTVNLDNRHAQLYRKYQAKHWSPAGR